MCRPARTRCGRLPRVHLVGGKGTLTMVKFKVNGNSVDSVAGVGIFVIVQEDM